MFRVGQHHVNVSYCMCCTKVEKLIALRLWPATPLQPKVAFSFDLMELLHLLVLECQVSMHDAARMIDLLSRVRQKQVRNAEAV